MNIYTILRCFADFTSVNIRMFKNVIVFTKTGPFAFNFFYWYLSFAKPLVLGRETLGFTTWNQGFHIVISCLSQSTLIIVYLFILLHKYTECFCSLVSKQKPKKLCHCLWVLKIIPIFVLRWQTYFGKEVEDENY